MRVWINRLNSELLFDHDISCCTYKANEPNVMQDAKNGIETANFVERWIKTNKAVEVTFDGQPWPDGGRKKYVTMYDFGKPCTFEIHCAQKGTIPTYRAYTKTGETLFVEIYSRKEKNGCYRSHVRIRELKDGMPAFIILDH